MYASLDVSGKHVDLTWVGGQYPRTVPLQDT